MGKKNEFGERLEKLCKERGIAVNELARRISVSSKTVHEWVGTSGRLPRNPAHLKALSQFFNVSVDFLLFGEEKLNLVIQAEESAGQVETAKRHIEANAKAVKLSLKKAKPHLQKKLLGALFQQLVATDTGIKVFYHLAESKNLIGNLVKTKKPSEKNSDGDSISSNWRTSQTLGFFSSKSSPIHCVGGGGNSKLTTCNYWRF